MTMWASDNGKGQVQVSITHGPVSVQVTEDPGHLRNFWSELGRVLDKTENPVPAPEI